MTDFQQSVYQTVLDSEDVNLLLRSSEKCDCQSGRTRRGCCYAVSSLCLLVEFLDEIFTNRSNFWIERPLKIKKKQLRKLTTSFTTDKFRGS